MPAVIIVGANRAGGKQCEMDNARSVGQSPRAGRVESLSGSARVGSTNVLPSGELRGLTKLIKITEDVRKYAAEQELSAEQALSAGLNQKAKEFTAAGAEIYAKG